SKSDLFGVVKVISMLHAEQYDKIRDEVAQSRHSIPHDINAKLPSNTWMDPGINMKVVPLGLRRLRQQYELTLQPTFNYECSGTFEKTMGVPCGHTIRELMGINLKVSAAHFDAYWLYNRPVPAPPVVAPDPLHDIPAQLGLKVRAKGRPRKNDTSTRRLPSAWERDEGPRSSGVSCNSILYLI